MMNVRQHGEGWRLWGTASAVGMTVFLAFLVPPVLPGAVFDPGGNGVSDVWEARYGVADPSGATDSDADGRTDLEEAQEGTDPGDPASVFAPVVTVLPAGQPLLTWQSREGRRYRVEGLNPEGAWVVRAEHVPGNGTLVGFADADYSPGEFLAYRAVVVGNDPVLPEIEAEMSRLDTDGDGQSDFVEWQAGTSPVDGDERFVMTALGFGEAVGFTWFGVDGMVYRIEEFDGTSWQALPGRHTGAGGELQVALARPAGAGPFRVVQEATDRDADGLEDWEERLLGLDPEHPKTRRQDATDLELVTAGLSAGGTLVLEAYHATLLVDDGEEGAVRIRREGGFAETEVPLVVGGDAVAGADYEALPASVTIPFGAAELMIPVRLLPGSPPSTSKRVSITLGASPSYSLGETTSRDVSLLRENLVDVRTHGALGDGVADDADAIQAAIDAVEADPTLNGLYFPPGTYRVQRPIGTPGNYRILEIGLSDLAGRDLVLRGAPGSVVHYDSGNNRAHIFRCEATFRSLFLRGMHIEKSADLLWATPGRMPIQSAGVFVARHDERPVQQVSFRDCRLVNCHRSVTVSGFGYDIRGRLAVVSFNDCDFLAPYGSNTQFGATAWGGGQAVNLTAWVGEGRYEHNVFEGGGEDMSDPATSPGGVVQDGSHAGSPLRFVFRGNIVRRTGVEAVFLQNNTTYMGATNTEFTMPPDDDLTEVSVTVGSAPSTFVPGEHIVIRTPLTPGVAASNTTFTIRAFDPVTRELRLSNPGFPDNPPPGTTFTTGRQIYLDERWEPPVGLIENNFMDGTPPTGASLFVEHGGIVFNGRSRVRGNFLKNYGRAIMSYVDPHTPAHPASAGSVVERNVIYTRDAQVHPDVYTYGIKLSGPEQRVRENVVVCAVSYRTVGIGLEDADPVVSGNIVWAERIRRNGYTSQNRSVGIASANSASGLLAKGNLTRGFDVGVGPSNAFQSIPFTVIDHVSIEDVLPVDPRGLQNP